jgi:uncharacterized ferritin-like protein (DUF455 family)
LISHAAAALKTKDTHLKIKLVENLYQDYLEGHPFILDDHVVPDAGYPSNLKLVPSKELFKRKGNDQEARALLLHSIAHIEFNAINLALDAMLRFKNMPQQYYLDWLKVAREEAYHFTLLNKHMNYLGAQYGDFAAHNGLWSMAIETQYSVLARMALVPRLLEARGLDMAPLIMKKLQAQGDYTAYKILWIILNDEIEHVTIGNRWYHWCCRQEALDPLETFKQLLHKHAPNVLKKPFNWQKRLQAGFNTQEQQFIESLVSDLI